MIRLGKSLRDVGLLAAAVIGFAAPASEVRAQAGAGNENLISQLAALEVVPDLDLAALRQQALTRVKSKADATPLKRPLVAAQLRKLPQIALDVQFDADTPIVRPASYRTLGLIADVLTHPTLLPYAFLIVGHTAATGYREANLILSQKRADSIREVLVNTFKISPKRLKTIGLGEEQLLDGLHPAAPINQQVQIVTVGTAP
jgi:OmpA-OmpF porin, OOP family